MQYEEILTYWRSLGNTGWWKKDDAVDQEIIDRFSDTHALAAADKLDHWLETPDGALALTIVLDQFSRNMFRGNPKTFAQDAKALTIAKMAIDKQYDLQCVQDLRVFFYLPFEHSEYIADQKRSVALTHAVGNDPDYMKAALEHYEIIQRFGRFPHRNAILGRHTTPAEQAYLDGGGFKG